MFHSITFTMIIVEVRTAVAARGNTLTFHTIDSRAHGNGFGRAYCITCTAVVHIRRFINADVAAFCIIWLANTDCTHTRLVCCASGTVIAAMAIGVRLTCFVI